MSENLSATEFNNFRIFRWLELANNREAEIMLKEGKSVLDVKKFLPLFEKSIVLIRKEFAKRKMVWCHGLFAPYKIMKKGGRYFLLDFGHAKLYPEGYELAFIIWADWMMLADWHLSYKEWKKGISGWLEETEKINKVLRFKNFKPLMRVSLIERILGSILAEVCASDKPREEKQKRLELLFSLWRELL